ncbi:MAG: hypothetical protein M0C28_46580 [Candidatus Moduliflexus flocculans]|nr:hypothetical protein [Candidatus Moduliflexus flocculans]
MLAYSIELRGAPFAFWIKDLSVYDPFYVAADPDRHHDAGAAADDAADLDRPGAAEDVHADAGDLHGDVPVGAERPEHLLARQQRARHRPAVFHEPDHRARRACRARRPSGASRRRATDRYEQRTERSERPHRRVRDRGDHGHGPDARRRPSPRRPSCCA